MIRSFTNSFFQLNNYINFNCVEPIELCLPVYQDSDLYGWSLFTDDDVFPPSNVKYYFRVVKSCSEPIGDFNPADWNEFNYTSNRETGTVLTPRNIKDPSPVSFGIEDMNCGECFFIQVARVVKGGDVISEEIVGCMGCFQKICDPCYTTVIQYYNNEDAFGFLYSGLVPGLFNRVRLPLYLKQPQFPTQRTVFTLSNGSKKKLASRIEKEWVVQTDFMPKEWHERLVIALEHDFFGLENTNSNTLSEFMMEDTYPIDWQDFLDYPMAQVKFKLKQIPYNNSNSNCL